MLVLTLPGESNNAFTTRFYPTKDVTFNNPAVN
jgi:hypothetical protein